MADSHSSDEENAGLVAVANGPADEVGMRLASKGRFGDCHGGFEGGGVGGVLEGVQAMRAVFVAKIQLARRVEGDVVAHHAVYFLSHWLDGD